MDILNAIDSSDPPAAPPSPAPAGEPATVAELFVACYPEMVRLAGLLGADDPEDIAQEAFARLFRHQRYLRDPGATIGYLRTTVCNLTRDRHRHLQVVRRHGSAAVATAASAEDIALLSAEHRAVVGALADLPPRRREAIVLRYWLGLSEAETARTMGTSTGTVKSNVSRGLAALGQALKGRP